MPHASQMEVGLEFKRLRLRSETYKHWRAFIWPLLESRSDTCSLPRGLVFVAASPLSGTLSLSTRRCTSVAVSGFLSHTYLQTSWALTVYHACNKLLSGCYRISRLYLRLWHFTGLLRCWFFLGHRDYRTSTLWPLLSDCFRRFHDWENPEPCLGHICWRSELEQKNNKVWRPPSNTIRRGREFNCPSWPQRTHITCL